MIKKILKADCDRCDGCGWYEGGKYIHTTCEKCHGKGYVILSSKKPSRKVKP